MVEEEKKKADRRDPCGGRHARESHDWSGCLCWFEADAAKKCPCKVFVEKPN